AQSPDCRVLLVGRTDNIKAQLRKATARGDATLMLRRLEVIEAPELVEMHEDVRSAIRHKKNSSMRVAIDLVKSGRAHACVSAGNTGALMGT
ncbi:MAG: phosphate acyltransferase, partial [Usitatibacteraceae bacterium]